MSSAVSALIPQLANYNPQGFALKNQQLQGEIGLNAAQAAQMRQQTALTQQQTAGLAQEQAIKQQSLQDAQIVRDAYMKTDGKPENITPYLLKNGISGTGLMGWQQHAYDLLTKAQTFTADQLKNQETMHNLAGDAVDSLNQIKDDVEMQASYQQMLPRLQAEAPDVQWKPQVTRDDLDFYSGVLGHANTVLKQAQERQAAATAAAQEQKDIQETRRTKLTNDLLEKSQQGGDPAELTGGQHPIVAIGQGLPPNDPTMLGLKNMYDQGGNVRTLENGLVRYPLRERAIEDMGMYLKSIGEATNPQIRAGKVATAVQEAQATAPIKEATSLAEARALRQGDNPALAGVPPAMSQGVANKALELDNSALAAKKATEDLGHFLDLAESGNKAAGSNLSMLGAESIQALNGIKRINSTEIAGYEGAGNLLDRIKGRIGKLVEGQPVPQDVMDDIRELHQTLGTSAYQQYVSGLTALNQRTGSKYAPIVEAPSIRKGAAPTPAGKGQKLTDPNIARQYLTKAGGDKEKARQLAKQDGWTF